LLQRARCVPSLLNKLSDLSKLSLLNLLIGLSILNLLI